MAAATILEYAFQKTFLGLKNEKTNHGIFSKEAENIVQSKKRRQFQPLV
jgi:hypothetical protein